jgi:hypothetical protein
MGSQKLLNRGRSRQRASGREGMAVELTGVVVGAGAVPAPVVTHKVQVKVVRLDLQQRER